MLAAYRLGWESDSLMSAELLGMRRVAATSRSKVSGVMSVSAISARISWSSCLALNVGVGQLPGGLAGGLGALVVRRFVALGYFHGLVAVLADEEVVEKPVGHERLGYHIGSPLWIIGRGGVVLGYPNLRKEVWCEERVLKRQPANLGRLMRGWCVRGPLVGRCLR